MIQKDRGLIEQKYSDDCGIAALAMLYGVPYRLIAKLIYPKDTNTFIGTTQDHAMRVGRYMKDPITVIQFTKTNREHLLPYVQSRKAVLVVPAKDNSNDYHAVYWNGYSLLDPSPLGKYHSDGLYALAVSVEAWIPYSES